MATTGKAAQGNQVDEKVMRRRMQYKFHQRRHRAKQKEKTLALTQEVDALLTEIERLNRKRERLMLDRNCFMSRGTDAGVPARIAMEYFRVFEYGINPRMVVQQEQFLRSIMTWETAGPDYIGVDTLFMLWKRIAFFFVYCRFQLLSIDVSTVGESTVVVVDTNFHISGTRDGILSLYPSLRNYSEMLQRVIGSMLVVPVQYRFEFDSNGIVTWFSAEWDLVSALSAIGSLEDAASALVDANISKTGQIRTTIENMGSPCSVETEVIDPRLEIDFLLS